MFDEVGFARCGLSRRVVDEGDNVCQGSMAEFCGDIESPCGKDEWGFDLV